MLWSVLRIRDLINIITHHCLELRGAHSLRKLLELLLADVHLLALDERVINLLLLLLGLRVHPNPVEIFRCVRIHFDCCSLNIPYRFYFWKVPMYLLNYKF